MTIDELKALLANPEKGCYVDDNIPGSCVLDDGHTWDCSLCHPTNPDRITRKEDCEYWRPLPPATASDAVLRELAPGLIALWEAAGARCYLLSEGKWAEVRNSIDNAVDSLVVMMETLDYPEQEEDE